MGPAGQDEKDGELCEVSTEFDIRTLDEDSALAKNVDG